MYTYKESHFAIFFFFMFFHSFPLTYFFRLYTSLRLSNMYRTMPRVIRGILLTNVAVEKIDLLQRELSAFSSISFWGSYSTFGDSFRSITVSSALLLSSGYVSDVLSVVFTLIRFPINLRLSHLAYMRNYALN